MVFLMVVGTVVDRRLRLEASIGGLAVLIAAVVGTVLVIPPAVKSHYAACWLPGPGLAPQGHCWLPYLRSVSHRL